MAEVRRIPADDVDAQMLLTAMVDEVSEAYGRIDVPGMPTATVSEMSPPGGCFVALYEDGRAVAGGAVKRFADGIAEIKRMYVVPDRRGHGLAKELLVALQDAARDLGYRVARLDTGPRQPHAEAMYRAAGYREIDNYNGNYMASYWGEKEL
jgi:GNAT superfamily N-acetyltransferase